MLIGTLFALAVATAPAASPAPVGVAPDDDFGFVAWCEGALTGHMEMRKLVEPELEAFSPGPPDDAVLQQEAGEEYLELYGRALAAAESASPTALAPRAARARAAGYAMWAEAKNVDDRRRMWAYLMWELPGRCETAAKRLEENSSLLGEALRPGSGTPIGPSATGPAGGAQ